MTISEQIKLVVDALEEWLDTNGGRVFVASDVVDCLDRLRARPGTPTAAVLFWKREPRGELGVTGRKDNHFKLVISRGRSFKVVSGEGLTEGAAGGKAMFDLVEEAELAVLGVRLPAEEGLYEDSVPQHDGTGVFEVSGMVMDAYEIRFSLATQSNVQMPDDE